MGAAIRTALTWMAGFMQERGGPSSTRLIMLAGTLVPLTLWAVLSVYYLRMEAIPESVLFFVGLCLGLKTADKAITSRADVAEIEKNKPPAAEPTTISKSVQVMQTETK